MDDTVGAFIPGPRAEIAGSTNGPLAGLAFAVKDIIDVASTVTGCGNPDWLATHGPAAAHAPCVAVLLAAGATLAGKTVTEEFATGLFGENTFYGAPVNVAAPGRAAGGSSSGSAAAVAAGLVDFALGTDTGGSVRAPASFCGLWGHRPTHGRITLAGVMPLAPSLDAVGWFARDSRLLARVGHVLLGGYPAATPGRLLVARDSMARLAPAHRAALRPAIDRVAAILGRQPEEIDIADCPGLPGLEAWAAALRTVWGYEAWRALGPWMTATGARLGPATAERFAARAKVTRAEHDAAVAQRAVAAGHIDRIMRDNAVLLLPAAPGIAPPRGNDPAANDIIRQTNERLSCVSGLAGLPQTSAPLATAEGCPLGLGLAAARGNDEMLLAIARQL
ncbi:MAG: amidase [Alphaproteobacteria bacterium]|nr:amidase [Alphaproteobacteria bacterium]